MTASHETRIDVALALGGWVTFCSCGRLTGFADTAAGAEKIASDHKKAAEPEPPKRKRMPSSTPAPGPKGASLPGRVPTDWMIENGYASELRDRFGEKIPGVGVSVSPSDDRMIFHYLTGRPAPANHPAGSAAAAQWDYKGRGNLAARAAEAHALAARDRQFEECREAEMRRAA